MSEFFYYMFLPFRKYADFSGRARRKEFWLFMLFLSAPGLVLMIWFIFSLFYYPQDRDALVDLFYSVFTSPLFMTFLDLYNTIYLLSLIPIIAVTIRRLHAINMRGWWSILIFALPPVLLYFGLRGSDKVDNKYGSNPLSEKMVKRSIDISGGDVKRFFHYMLLPLRKCFDFSGRARRLEFWAFTLFYIVVYRVLYILDSYFSDFGLLFSIAEDVELGIYLGLINVDMEVDLALGVLSVIGLLVFLVPYFALFARRLHDIGMRAWLAITLYIIAMSSLFIISFAGYYLDISDSLVVGLAIPVLIMVIFLFYISLRQGDEGANRYGDDPLTEKVA